MDEIDDEASDYDEEDVSSNQDLDSELNDAIDVNAINRDAEKGGKSSAIEFDESEESEDDKDPSGKNSKKSNAVKSSVNLELDSGESPEDDQNQ